MILDIACFIFSSLLSYLMVYSTGLVTLRLPELLISAVLYTVCNTVSLYIFGVYRKLWRYATIQDFVSCIIGTAIGSLFTALLLILMRIISEDFAVSNIYNFINFLTGLTLILAVRILYKQLRVLLKDDGKARHGERTLLVGAGTAGEILLSEMKSCNSPYQPICVMDDDPAKIGRTINGLPIEGPLTRIPAVCKDKRIQTILIALPSSSELQRKRIVKICSETDCEIKILPYLHDMVSGNLLGQAANIRLEDLLGREPVSFNMQKISCYVKGKVCLVTGGGGSIGSELCRQIARHEPRRLVIVDIYENNAYAIQQELLREYGDSLHIAVEIASVREFQKMNVLFARYRPDLVFHAAAHKHVPLMETAPEEAVKNNVVGTFYVASLADWYRCEKFVLISTDKAVNPTNVMGATKRCCEMIVQYFAQQSEDTEFVAVRFGNVLGSNGSVIPLFKEQIENGGPVTVTHPDIIRYFMTIPEAVSLVLQAGSIARGGEIFVLDMGEPVKILTLAENLIRQYGYEPGVDMPIEFVGLRPGEKLFEEILMAEEGLRPTANQKIFIGNQIHVDQERFVKQLAQLKYSAEANDTKAVVRQLHEIVPTFSYPESDIDKNAKTYIQEDVPDPLVV